MNKGVRLVLIAIVMVSCLVNSVCADDIENEINAALSAYKKGEHTNAISSLEYAAQQIRQIKAEKIETLFPQTLKGWTSEKAESTAAGAMIMGGILSGSKKYRKSESTIDIEIVADNPMISVVIGMLSNPMMLSMAGGAKGTKIIKIKDEKAISEWDNEGKSGSIKIVVANKVLVSVNGDNCEQADIQAYAEAIDFAKIQSFIAQ